MADKTIVGLTMADRDLIQRFLDEKRRSSVNPVGRGREGQTEHEEWLAPEVYVARVAALGIPALVGSADEDVIGNEGDIPGYADCVIYRIATANGVPKLRKVSPAPKRVYNLLGSAITDVPWIPVMRDKFGSWLAMGGVNAEVGTGTDGEVECGYLILDCQDVVTEACCSPADMPSTATLTYKIGSLDSDTMSLTKVGNGYVGENHCVVDAHTEIFIQFASNCFGTAPGGYHAIQFSVSVYIDSSLENYVIWSDHLFIGEIDEKGYATCTPYSIHYESLNTSGVAAFTNPRTCGTGSDVVDYPFATAGGLRVTLDVVE